MVWPFARKEPADGKIFDNEPAPDGTAERVNKYLQNLEVGAREQIHMLTEMLDTVVEENNELKEENLRLRNELDRLKK